MSGPILDPSFAADLRRALAEEVSATARPSGHLRWRRAGWTTGAVLVLAASGAGVAAAAGWVPQVLPHWIPGLQRDTVLTPGVLSTHTGSVDIATTAAPVGTNGIALTFTCLDAGAVTLPDGSSVTCDGEPGGHPGAPYVIDLPPEGAPLVFTATPGMRWGLELSWVQRAATDWAVNARGETYGAVKDDGSQPDLLAAVSREGIEGYIRISELDAARGQQPRTPAEVQQWSQQPEHVVPINLYASDGITVLAHFEVPTRSAGDVDAP